MTQTFVESMQGSLLVHQKHWSHPNNYNKTVVSALSRIYYRGNVWNETTEEMFAAWKLHFSFITTHRYL